MFVISEEQVKALIEKIKSQPDNLSPAIDEVDQMLAIVSPLALGIMPIY